MKYDILIPMESSSEGDLPIQDVTGESESLSPQARNLEFRKVLELFPSASTKKSFSGPIIPDEELVDGEGQEYGISPENAKKNIEGGEIKDQLFAKLSEHAPFMQLTPSGRADVLHTLNILYNLGIPRGGNIGAAPEGIPGLENLLSEGLQETYDALVGNNEPSGEGLFGSSYGKAYELKRFEQFQRQIKRKEEKKTEVKIEDYNKLKRWKKDLDVKSPLQNLVSRFRK